MKSFAIIGVVGIALSFLMQQDVTSDEDGGSRGQDDMLPSAAGQPPQIRNAHAHYGGYGPEHRDGDGPPPGVVGEFTYGGEGEDVTPEDEWMSETTTPNDTAFFIWGHEPSEDKPFGGDQTFGTMDKLGVSHQAYDALTAAQQNLLNQIGGDNAAREAHDPTGQFTGGTWKILVCSLQIVNDEHRLVVRADYGHDVVDDTGIMPKASTTFGEVWRITESEVTLLERDETGLNLAGLGKTTAEMDQHK